MVDDFLVLRRVLVKIRRDINDGAILIQSLQSARIPVLPLDLNHVGQFAGGQQQLQAFHLGAGRGMDKLDIHARIGLNSLIGGVFIIT